MSAGKFITLKMIFLLGCAGCVAENHVSKRTNGGNIAVSGHEAVIIEDQGLELTPTAMKGTGTFVFTNPLRQISSGQSFTMTLSIETGGYADFRSYAYGNLTSGISVRFGKTDEHYTVEFGDGKIWKTPVSIGAEQNQPLSVTIDVDNNSSPASVIVFNGTNPVRRAEDILTQTEDSADTTRHGFGSYYGYVLNNSTLESFALAR